MVTLLLHLLRLLPGLCGAHRQVALENLAWRQQLAVVKRTVTRPKLRRSDRLLWVWLARAWTGWRTALVSVAPDTVLRGPRHRFRQYWTRFSGRPPGGRPPVNPQIKTLVAHMAAANLLGGAPRIHGELVKLGIDVSERTVSRRLPTRRTPPSQTWRTFLTHHVPDLVSIAFFTGPPASLRVLFVLVVLAHPRRRVLHVNVTEHPTAAWTAQQIVDPFPEDTAPWSLLRDRDSLYGHAFRQRVKGMGIREVLTAPQSPGQNPFAERLIGSGRRECLDPVIVLSERHLRRLLTSSFVSYHRARTHLALDKDAPDGRPIEPPQLSTIIPIPEVGGLHHRSVRRAAESNTGPSFPPPAHPARSSLPSGPSSVSPENLVPPSQADSRRTRTPPASSQSPASRAGQTSADVPRASRTWFWRRTGEVGRHRPDRTVPAGAQGRARSSIRTLRGLCYDERGQLLTGTLMDYGLPRADVVPAIDVAGRDSPSPLNPLGLKGTGEGSAGPPPAVVANAVADALADESVEINAIPITREAIRAATGRRDAPSAPSS